MPPNRTLGPGLLTLLALAGVYLLWRTLATGSWFLLSGTVAWVGYLLVVLVLVGPLLWWAVWWSRRRHESRSGELVAPEATPGPRPALLAVAALIFLAELLLQTAPNLAVHQTLLDWNWQGKAAALLFMLVFVALWPGLSWKETGLTLPGWRGWWPALVVTGVAMLFWATLGATQQPSAPTTETILFQATMPSLEEELVWRGIVWALVLQALPSTRRFGGQGWALLLTSLVFALFHGFVLGDDLSLTVNIPLLVFSLVAGLALGWIRIRSGSVLPAMAAHSGINLSAAVLPALLA